MLTPQSENPQNQYMTFTNSQQSPIIQESSINLNQLINTTINAKFIPPTPTITNPTQHSHQFNHQHHQIYDVTPYGEKFIS